MKGSQNNTLALLHNEEVALVQTMKCLVQLRASVFDVFEAWQTAFTRKDTGAIKYKAIMVGERKASLQSALNNFKHCVNNIPRRTAAIKTKDLVPTLSKSIQVAQNVGETDDVVVDRFHKFRELAMASKRCLEGGISSEFPDIALRMWTWKLYNQNTSRQMQLSDQSSPLFRTLDEIKKNNPKITASRIARPGTASELQGLHIIFENLFRVSIMFPIPPCDSESDDAHRIDMVNIRGFLEDTHDSDMWTASSHKVFQKLTSFASSAAEYFLSVLPNNVDALRQFILWLSSYHNLFSCTCVACGLGLIHDSHEFMFLPPLVRDFNDAQPYHVQCYRSRQ